MGVLSSLVLIALVGMVADTVVKLGRARAGGSKQLQGQIDLLRAQVEEQGAALAQAEADLAAHDAELRELQERVDFSERLLAQTRDRPSLGPGP